MQQKFLKQREAITRPRHSMVLNSELVHLVSQQMLTISCIRLLTMIPGQRWKVTACKEVIVSAGVFNSPQLLMLSGIGDPAELSSLGIPTRVNLPSVGKNMTDHVLLGNPWQVNNNVTMDSYLSPELLPLEIQKWKESNPHQGPLSWTVANQMAWLRLPENNKIIQTYGDPTVGPTSAHFQIIWVNGWLGAGNPKPAGNWMTIITNLISPTSRRCFYLLC